VTVDAINKKDEAILIKGPDGVVEVVDVANPETLDQVQVGEHIVVTLTDAFAIALDKEAAASSNEAPIIDPQVRRILNRACRELTSARTLTYHVEITFDSVLRSSVNLQARNLQSNEHYDPYGGCYGSSGGSNAGAAAIGGMMGARAGGGHQPSIVINGSQVVYRPCIF
jgi:hypothetical protein